MEKQGILGYVLGKILGLLLYSLLFTYPIMLLLNYTLSPTALGFCSAVMPPFGRRML